MCILVGNLLLALISRIPWQPIDELEDIQYTTVVYLRKIRKTIKFFFVSTRGHPSNNVCICRILCICSQRVLTRKTESFVINARHVFKNVHILLCVKHPLTPTKK